MWPATQTCSRYRNEPRLRILRLLCGSPRGHGGQRNPDRAGDSEFPRCPTPDKLKNEGLVKYGATEHSLVFGEYRRFGGTVDVSVLRMLHDETGHQTPNNHSGLKIGGTVSTQDIKEVVRTKYGEAALRAKTGAAPAADLQPPGTRAVIRSPVICTMPPRPAACRRRQSTHHSVRQSDGSGPTPRRRDRARSGLRRRIDVYSPQSGRGTHGKAMVWT